MTELMMDFARRTGLSPAVAQPRRYLWTDAFAVCNFLGLYIHTGERQYRDLALMLVDQVHHTLGRHRADDGRSGWISGLDEQEGERHPTIAGLRIGKSLPERGSGEPFDESLEWDRDGQYFHYLTRWMHALHRVSRVTGSPVYHQWALELARTAHARFTYAPVSGGPKRMYWKMSIDLSWPQVSSMGQHDPLDGFITFCQLQYCPSGEQAGHTDTDLHEEITDMTVMCQEGNWATDDTLGIGGLLCDAWKLAQMASACGFSQPDLLEHLLQDALAGLQVFARTHALELPPACRLPFRELGLGIGLRAVERLRRSLGEQADRYREHVRLQEVVDRLMDHLPLAREIEVYWLDPARHTAATWNEHLDINAVMLATSLAPDGYLSL